MALAANGVIARYGFAAMPDIVRVVAGGAFQRAIAFQEALRGAHPRDRASRLEAGIFVRSGSFVKRERECRQRLTWPIAEVGPLVAFDRMRQAEFGGLK